LRYFPQPHQIFYNAKELVECYQRTYFVSDL